MQNNVAIFGASGFIGTQLSKELDSFAHPILNRDQNFTTCKDIVYLISTNNNYNVFEDVHKDIHVNLTVLMNKLRNVTPDQTFNFISSWFVYGSHSPYPADESSVCNPKGFYSITKRCAEQLVISYCETFNIPYRILRLCNVYGHGDKPSPKKNALQYLIEEMRLGHSIKLYNNGNFYRDYMHVTDVCKAIKLCIEKAETNQIINISSGQKTMFRDIIQLAARQMKVTPRIEQCEPSNFHKIVQVKDFFMSNAKLQALGFKPSVSLEQGIRELVK